MDFTSQDIAVIEQALQLAIRSQSSDAKARPFQEVLGKLQASANAAMNAASIHKVTMHDGIRFDYDDSSDVL